MEKLITMQNLRLFAYCNNNICKKPIRGIVLSFFGLNGNAMYSEETEDGRYYAEKGMLYLLPYSNPWSWMNKQAIDYTNELVEVLINAFDLPDDIPIVSTGGSMGGLSALVYTAYAKRTPVACVANCPVCDLPFHFTEREDLPRTLYSAFGTYEGTLEEALRSASPLHLVDQLPAASMYCIFHCEEDRAVNKQMHSDRLVEKMRQTHNITYYAVPERGHCDLPAQMQEVYRAYVLNAVAENGAEV